MGEGAVLSQSESISSKPPRAGVAPAGKQPLTTFYLAGAVAGDREALERLARRLRPVLELMARYRLPDLVKPVYGEDDLIQDVWLVLLENLSRLRPVGGRRTPVLIRYVRKTITLRVRAILRREILRQARGVGFAAGVQRVTVTDPFRELISQDAVRFVASEIVEHIEALPEPARQIVLLRGVEQRPNREVAAEVGMTPKSVSKIYTRALTELRQRWPASVFSELPV